MKTLLMSTFVLAAGLVASSAEALTCAKTSNRLAEYAALTAEQKQALAAQPGDPTLGPGDAKGVIVEFIDYACPYCRRMADDFVRLAETHPEVQIVFKEYPIISEHASELAARASAAVADTTEWKAFHAALMGSRRGLGIEEAILEAADIAGIDLDRLEDGMYSEEVEATITGSCQLGYELGISATPTIIAWGVVVEGALPAAMLKPLATLTLEPNDVKAQEMLYDALTGSYDPDEYKYPKGFMAILKKIEANVSNRWEQFNSRVEELTKQKQEYTDEVENLTGWWMEVKAFFGLEYRPELPRLELQLKTVKSELKDAKREHSYLASWRRKLQFVIRKQTG